MTLRLTDDCSKIDWEALALVFRRAPLGDRPAERLRHTFSGSAVCCFAWDDSTLIGAGRAITDGVAYTVVFDVVVLPEYQNQGVGSRIMIRLIDAAKAPNVLLHAVPGKEQFYARLGFRRMKTAMARFVFPEQQIAAGYID